MKHPAYISRRLVVTCRVGSAAASQMAAEGRARSAPCTSIATAITSMRSSSRDA